MGARSKKKKERKLRFSSCVNPADRETRSKLWTRVLFIRLFSYPIKLNYCRQLVFYDAFYVSTCTYEHFKISRACIVNGEKWRFVKFFIGQRSFFFFVIAVVNLFILDVACCMKHIETFLFEQKQISSFNKF